MTMTKLASLMRFPVKGLSGEPLSDMTLVSGDYVPWDRAYAIENGPSGYDPKKPEHQPKTKFCVLARIAEIARLKTRFDTDTQTLTIEVDGIEAAAGNLETQEGRQVIEDFLKLYLADSLTGEPKIVKSVPVSVLPIQAVALSRSSIWNRCIPSNAKPAIPSILYVSAAIS